MFKNIFFGFIFISNICFGQFLPYINRETKNIDIVNQISSIVNIKENGKVKTGGYAIYKNAISINVNISADTITIPFDSVPNLIATITEPYDSMRWSSYTLTGTLATPTNDSTTFDASSVDSTAGGGWLGFIGYEDSSSDKDSIYIELCSCGSFDPPSFLTTDTYTYGWYMNTEDSLTLGTGGNVVSWKGGWGNSISQGFDTTYCPHWNSVDKYIQWDGTDDFLIDFTSIHSQPVTIYILMNQVSLVDNDVIVMFDGGDAIPFIKQGTSSVKIGAGGTGISSGTVTTGSFNVYTFIFNTTSSSITINNGTPTTGSVGTEATADFRVGVGETGCASMQIKEIIIRATADDETEQTAVYNYLYNKD
jgi:hypothetical protein